MYTRSKPCGLRSQSTSSYPKPVTVSSTAFNQFMHLCQFVPQSSRPLANPFCRTPCHAFFDAPDAIDEQICSSQRPTGVTKRQCKKNGLDSSAHTTTCHKTCRKRHRPTAPGFQTRTGFDEKCLASQSRILP